MPVPTHMQRQAFVLLLFFWFFLEGGTADSHEKKIGPRYMKLFCVSGSGHSCHSELDALVITQSRGEP